MYGREKRVLLRRYWLEQGLNETEPAERLGISRCTVYRWIATAQPDRDLDAENGRYRARPAKSEKLDA
jgi:transposase